MDCAIKHVVWHGILDVQTDGVYTETAHNESEATEIIHLRRSDHSLWLFETHASAFGRRRDPGHALAGSLVLPDTNSPIANALSIIWIDLSVIP